MSLAIVLPLRSFATAKSRLRDGRRDVDHLVRELASAVVRAASPRPLFIVTDAADVSNFATSLRVPVLHPPQPGLNQAVQWAFGELASAYDHLMIVHGDLRDPTGIGDFVPMSDLTIVRDQHGTGTPVLVVPTYVDFRFQYGPGSARLHAEEGHRHGLSVSVLDNRWSFDIDEPADLAEEAKTRGPAGPLV